MLAPSTLAVPRGRSHQPEQHRNRRRLTGAIRADEPGDDPGGDLEAQAVDRQSAACDRVGAETSVRRFPRFDAHFLTRYLWFSRARASTRSPPFWQECVARRAGRSAGRGCGRPGVAPRSAGGCESRVVIVPRGARTAFAPASAADQRRRICLSRSPFAESSMRVASRFSRVSSRLALVT
jgi:hypothetical protein